MKLTNKITTLAFCIAVLGIASVSAQSKVIDMQYNAMKFHEDSRTVIKDEGSNGQTAGSVHRYSNVSEIEGVSIDAELTILKMNNAKFNEFDDDTKTGDIDRFQPRIYATKSSGGYISFQLEFFESGTENSVFLYNYWFTGVDVDGTNGGQRREYGEVGGFSSYFLDRSTQLTVSSQEGGRTRFLGRATSLGGVTFDNTASYMLKFKNPNNKITFALGVTQSGQERFFSVQMGSKVGQFSNPIEVTNPTPVAVDDQGIDISNAVGGVSINSVFDNDLYNNEPINPSDFVTTIINEANHDGVQLDLDDNGKVTVEPGTKPGTYTIDYQICLKAETDKCDIATATVNVIAPLVAVDDNTATKQNTPVEIKILDNDVEGSSEISASTVTFIEGTEPNSATVGEFKVDDYGVVTFTPVTAFTGTTTIDYQVCDAASNCDIATITVRVDPLQGPTAVDNKAFTDKGVRVRVDVVNNDIAGSGAIVLADLELVAGTAPDASEVGVFRANDTGKIIFIPASDFVGTTSVDYIIYDENGLSSVATLTIVVEDSSDKDGDGVSNEDDEFPTDPDRAYIVNYPTEGYGTLAFEDLWPKMGDYDFNDLVVDYKFVIVLNADNLVKDVDGTFVVKAFGAGMHNGFGFQFDNDDMNQELMKVSGSIITENYVTLNGNGLEASQDKPTVIVFDDSYTVMEYPGVGTGVNTAPEAPYVTPETVKIDIDFETATYSLRDFNIAAFNPFLIVDQTRGREIHLPDYEPTSLVDNAYFSTHDDSSKPGSARYYKTANNHPWAINIYNQFDYPKEYKRITDTHLHFGEWAESSGSSYADWYLDKIGYRYNDYIYMIP